MKIKWKCEKCNEELISDSLEHHKMDWCNCGESGLDAEEEYIRLAGKTKILTKNVPRRPKDAK